MNHYERLGIARDATPNEVRDAYRRAARATHPDRAGEGSAAAMAAVNEAYRVLGDPARRRRYDADLGTGAATGAAGGAASRTPPAPSVSDVGDVAAVHPPGRFPWRFLLVMGSLASVVVLVGAIVTDPAEEPPIDNVLRPGDCVVLTATLEAAEAACSGPHDAVVEALVPFDQTCPNGTEAFRDRQGMGTACVVRAAPTAPD